MKMQIKHNGLQHGRLSMDFGVNRHRQFLTSYTEAIKYC